ncbi:MAG: DNA mismatch repair protein MutS, partial [Clostridiales bacterium]|nr:DNA mismatch repair protein MutS [Clostridiales bacterium]
MKTKLSPMMEQYLEIKKHHPKTILFFRLGDFYEMFFEDAQVASKELELVLTGRDCGQEERAPMCGVPYHSCEAYIARLVEKGYKVAICEQLEDPSKAKGIVKRDVVRIISPGTVIEGSMLKEGANNYLSTIATDGERAGLCFADLSTGEIHLTELMDEDLPSRISNETGRFSPREAILSPETEKMPAVSAFLKDRIGCVVTDVEPGQFEEESCADLVCRHFGKPLPKLGLSGLSQAVRALGAALKYFYENQKTGLERLAEINLYQENQYMGLDISTRRNLELTETMRSKEKRGTLLWVLDKTKTAMGKRLIRCWLEQPLLSPAQITRRLNAVEELYGDSILRGDVSELLDGMFDLERLMTRIIYGSANGRELRALARTLSALPALKERLKDTNSGLLSTVYRDLDPLEDVCSLIDSAIVDDPPISVREGGIIRRGYNQQLDEIMTDMTDGKGFIARIEAEEREKTGIKSLKVSYNKVFGYYIEVTKANLSLVPDTYIRKQTLTSCERFITQELKELEARVLGAREKLLELEYQLFEELRRHAALQLHRIQAAAKLIAMLDVLTSFAEVAVANGYCRPDVTMDGAIRIEEGRHPVVEAMARQMPFVPNDTALDLHANRAAIITGPNMAGKSTYMRQVALITLMAQIGSFVPAQSASISIVDNIFTRVGASDDLGSGQSTFMVEMNEVAFILKNATSHSLLILDEIGR